MQWIIAFICSTAFAFLAFAKRKLSLSGMIGALFVGTSIFGATGLYGFLVLTFFFVSSNLLGRMKWLFQPSGESGKSNRSKLQPFLQKAGGMDEQQEGRTVVQQESRLEEQQVERLEQQIELIAGVLNEQREGQKVSYEDQRGEGEQEDQQKEGQHEHKQKVSTGIVEKGDRRDAYQVFANGGFAAIAALSYAVFDQPIWLVMMCASLAAATADTWASELGRWSTSPPVHILTRKRVEQGTSGAITPLGTWASLGGALLTALISIPLFLQIPHDLKMNSSIIILIILLTGWLGNWIDTYVGAKWQALYRCPVCMRSTERKWCHAETRLFKGFHWMNNDAVNTLCTVSAGTIAAIGIILISL